MSALNGSVALITGASSGIGEATALALAALGANVAVVARRRDRLDALVKRIETAGGTALALEADVADEAQARGVVTRAYEKFGQLDIVVNNAGVMLLAPVAESDINDWRRMIDINLFGLMVVTNAALPLMKRGGKGHFVNVSSVAGRVANPSAGAYAATKFGVVAFSESLRREVYNQNIRVTVIEPGIVATELGDHITHAGMKASLKERVAAIDVLQPEDVAAAIVYAVSQPPHVGVNEILLRPTAQER